MTNPNSAKASAPTIILGAPLNAHDHLFAALVAVIGTLLFAFPSLGSLLSLGKTWPGYMATGDIRMLWFPQFVLGYEQFWSGQLLGVDFLTSGGASAFGLRTNLLPLYPPFIISYLLFDCSNFRISSFLFNGLNIAHVFACIYFCVLLGKRYFALENGGAALFAAIYALSFQAGTYIAFTPFFFQMMLVPMVAYTGARLISTRSLLAVLIGTAVFLNFMLTSYAPTMLAGLAVAALLITYLMYATRLPTRIQTRLLLRPMLSLAFAITIALPYYLAQADNFRHMSGLPKHLAFLAHADSFTGRGLFAAISNAIIGAPLVEGRIYVGLVALSVLLFGLLVMAMEQSKAHSQLRSLVIFGLSAFLASAFVSLGPDTIASDIFYYGVPVLGRMHLYQRYLMFTQIFLALAVAASALIVVSRAHPRLRGLILVAAFSVWPSGTVLISIVPSAKTVLNVSTFLPELLFALIAVAILSIGRTHIAVAAIALPVLAGSLVPLYGLQRALGTPDLWEHHLPFKQASQTAALEKMTPEGKVLIKVLNVTDEIDSYLPHNFPWLNSAHRKLMTFYGYELHLSADRDYLRMMGGFYGRYNREWVLRTGVDFVVWNDASAWKLHSLSSDTVSIGPPTPLGGGQYIARLKYGEPARSGQKTALLSLAKANPAAWRPSTIEGWKLVDGALVKVPGVAGAVAIPFGQLPGAIYDVSLDVMGSTAGTLSVALGGRHGDPIDGAQPSRVSRRFTIDGLGDLWISADTKFDGSVTNVEVREVTRDPFRVLTPVFDNGVLRLEADGAQSSLKSFDTNWSTNVSAKIDGSAPSRLVFLLWPNRFLKPYLDGTPVEWVRNGAWPAYIDVPAGEHIFELRFTSLWVQTFRVVIVVYLLIFGGLLLARSRSFLGTLRRTRFGNGSAAV